MNGNFLGHGELREDWEGVMTAPGRKDRKGGDVSREEAAHVVKTTEGFL